MFLMPGLVVAFHVTGAPLGEARRAGMEAYLRNHQQVEYGETLCDSFAFCGKRRGRACRLPVAFRLMADDCLCVG